jgi:hypothetical protein
MVDAMAVDATFHGWTLVLSFHPYKRMMNASRSGTWIRQYVDKVKVLKSSYLIITYLGKLASIEEIV